MKRNRLYPFVPISIALLLGAVMGLIVSIVLYKLKFSGMPHLAVDPDGDIEFAYDVIGVFTGSFVGLIVGIFVNVWMSNRDAETNNSLSLGS